MAAGDTLIVFTPIHNCPTTALPATLDTRGSNEIHYVLDFDAAQTESAVFQGIMPRHFSTSGNGCDVNIKFGMSACSDTSEAVAWAVAFERVATATTGIQDIDGSGFAAVNTTSQNPSGTLGVVKNCTVAFTAGADMDSVGPGNPFRLRIQRDHDHAEDIADGDAELWAVELRQKT